MNIVFIGSSTFGLRCLDACIRLPEIKVTGVVTSSQTFAISYRPSGVTNVLHADITNLADSHNIPITTLQRAMNEPGLLEVVTQWKPDAFLVAGWYHMIPKRWRELAPAYGLHASLLPDYSGGAPLVWAIINGEAKTGITLFQMDDGVDSGWIVGQKEEIILPNDTIATLYARIEERGLELLNEALPKLLNGSVELKTQDETKRRVMPQRSPEDGWINWWQEAEAIDRFIRAQTRPYPGAFSIMNGKKFIIWSAKPTINKQLKKAIIGEIIKTDEHYFVQCNQGKLQLTNVTYGDQNFNEQTLTLLLGDGGQQFDSKNFKQ
ncbi:MAG: methionyl-tRNA formyltransferase [Candidatus Thiothrix moscowensis]|nr:methionyl-tRNA formyltransferase [Candidatus Thiothrix moscowensis]